MGTFLGHVIPGVSLGGVGLWWIVQILLRYYESKRNGGPFKSTPTFKCNCLCGRLKTYEIEGLVKTILCIIGLIGEIITGFEDGKFVHYGNAQHSTMFVAFGITSVVDVMRHHKFPIAEEVSYALLASCLAIEGVLFKYHLHGRNEIDVLIHTLLVYTIFCNFLAVLAELRFRNSFLAALFRGYFFLLQGIWFIGVGFILHNPFKKPDWDPENHDHMMVATMLFAWHILGALLLILILNCAVAFKYQKGFRIQPLETPYRKLTDNGYESRGLLDNNANGHAIDLEDIDDFESEPSLSVKSLTASGHC